MLAEELVLHSTVRVPEGLLLRFLTTLDCVGQRIGRHDKAHNSDLLRLAADLLYTISDTVKNAVDDLVVRKTIDKEFLNRKRFDQRRVPHSYTSPKQNNGSYFCGGECALRTFAHQAKRSNNRRGIASCSDMEHSQTPCFVGSAKSIRRKSELRERHCSDREFSASAQFSRHHASVAGAFA
jgi:hypothetical protein